ncbi:MAG: D-glycero-alpha-D-manno-heptose-1,7-bisphosphate 7-phosphatase [Desulfomonilia bacterium]|uniref:D,D-heptose 1,7-bisphosphate phosphatase n=1 Tax=anaerobic digester metagenome TaxID=1263854 RepID=A0A485M881_9ZZZZ|nr:HAD family hydrolase [Pseudomonadota bacterium]HON38418.1 HAD family hydrolase [Deltaproteobacteria bacterium]HRS54831.1 HAD family hydrolase [Desulfomonilia bacterium]HPD20197.1 HAD family hydrolase [Deltaproteobacteria bacterium]HPX17983.1 HAD family hydrolase [Deltaproteobacteria bacterium]
MSGRAVFLDRDDTIIRDRHYLADPDGVELMPGAAEAIRLLNRHHIPAIVVTNQSGIARGLFDEHRLELIHQRLTELLAAHNAVLDAIYYCPHHPHGSVERYSIACTCRKPEPGLLMKAARDFGLDLAGCYMVGDKPEDMETIRRVRGKGVLIEGESTEQTEPAGHDHRMQNLFEAVQWILKDMKE